MYEQAAHLGYAQAQYNLGIMYATGEDVAKEIATNARQWWRPKQQHKRDEDARKNK